MSSLHLFFTILPRDLLCTLSCCTFTFVSYTTMPQPTTVSFSLFCILGTGFLFSLLLIFLLLSCFFFHTSYIVLLSFLYLHLPLFFSITILQDNSYTTHFLTILQRQNLSLVFVYLGTFVFTFFTLYKCYYFLLHLLFPLL